MGVVGGEKKGTSERASLRKHGGNKREQDGRAPCPARLKTTFYRAMRVRPPKSQCQKSAILKI